MADSKKADLKKKATKKAASGEGLGAGGCKIGVDYGCRSDVPAMPKGKKIKVDQTKRQGGSDTGEGQTGGRKSGQRRLRPITARRTSKRTNK